MKSMIMFAMMAFSLYASEFTQAVDDYNKGEYTKAFDTFYLLAKDGNAKAQYNTGLLYAQGKGAQKDLSQAKKWYEKAAKQGNASAQYNLAKLHHSAGTEDPHAYEKAKYWYEKAVKGGIVQANNNLAALYIDGLGVEKNEQKALMLLEEASSKGDAAAQVNIAVLYAWGEDVTHDKMKAYENFRAALQNGKSEASGYLDKLCQESAWVCKD
ncbi:tetratricopeptide repeat protein [Sulfurovum sp.]|uniref:tetratricopeptide repeat protein n=1 Tax=Sulfurovum sp. TaxID=1969726 RepID=UPI002867BA10|nr:tetratricopeptide repeat protein [Sulfurovum sp.]